VAKGTLRIRIVGDASNLQRTLGNATGTLANFAKKGLLALGAATVAGVAGSIRAFANFDQAMTNSLAIMGDVSDTMRRDMSDAAREVAKTTQFSATQAAESYFFLASAGMDAEQSIAALPQVAAFAQAGMFDMARATDLATDAQSALGMIADDAAENLENLTRVTDVLVGANTLANASVEQFGSAVQIAGGAMRMAGIEIEEGVAVLAAWADQGIKGDAAGTMFKSTLEGLQRFAILNADAFKDLGVAVYDTEGNMNNFADIVGDIEDALDGMSVEQQKSTLMQMGFNRQSLDGIMALMGLSDQIREYEGDLTGMAGVTQDVADKQLQTFWAQLGLVKDNLVDVGLSIGEALMPALMQFVDWIQEKLPAITSTMQGWADKFVGHFQTTSEAVQENETVLDGWARRAIAERERVVSDYEQFPAELRARLPKPADFDEFVTAAGDAGDQGGIDFLAKFKEAASILWEQDIKPWLTGTVVPWLEETLLPLVYEAGRKLGVELGKGFLAGAKYLVWDLPWEIGRDWGINQRESFQQRGKEVASSFETDMDVVAKFGADGFVSSWNQGARRSRQAPDIRWTTLPPAPREAAGQFYGIGQSMGSGMESGLAATSSRLASVAIGVVTGALNNARNAIEGRVAVQGVRREAGRTDGPRGPRRPTEVRRRHRPHPTRHGRTRVGPVPHDGTERAAVYGCPRSMALGHPLTIVLPDGRRAEGTVTGEDVVRALKQYERANGPIPVRAQ
jgi:TP901 family phage tail tape measure protein